jgi:hypothetical protein
VNALLTAEAQLPADPESAMAIDQLASQLMAQHQQQLLTAAAVTRERPNADTLPRRSARVVAFDFAPSYNFHVDGLAFDVELLRIRQALRPAAAIAQPAAEMHHELSIAVMDCSQSAPSWLRAWLNCHSAYTRSMQSHVCNYGAGDGDGWHLRIFGSPLAPGRVRQQ